MLINHNLLTFSIKKSVFICLILVFVFNCKSNQNENALLMVSNQMIKQEEAWNKGDLEGFMDCYWKSDSLRFIGKSGLNTGWQNTLDNYKKSYQNKQEMGTLKFTNKSLDFVGEQTIFVVGEWKLSREDSLGDLGGMYSLIWEKKNGVWVITTDHSS
jgi:ketosteroid isomerase-like protein